MKNKILFILLCFTFSNSSIAQQITVNFTVDNIFSAYVGNQNAVTTNKIPDTQKDGSQIFTATTLTANYNAGDWVYVIAWSDDKACQGMIGEIKYGNSTILTGDPRWEMYPTGMDFDRGQSPTMSQINSQIAIANNTGGWRAPSVGETNANTKKVCRAYPRPVTGINSNARWVWNNANNASSPFYPGFDHEEFIIFRVPMDKVVPATPPVSYDLCCPPITTEDIKKMVKIKANNLNTYKINLQLTTEFKKRIQAYANYRAALDPCFKKFVVNYFLKKPIALPRTFNFSGNTDLTQGGTVFNVNQNSQTTFLDATLDDVTLETNKWYRINMGIYGKGANNSECPNNVQDYNQCPAIFIDINLQTSSLRKAGGKLQGDLSQYLTISRSPKTSGKPSIQKQRR